MTGLATIDGTNVDVSNSNPVNAILHVISLEKQKYGLEVAQKVYDHYFDNKESNDIVIYNTGRYEIFYTIPFFAICF